MQDPKTYLDELGEDFEFLDTKEERLITFRDYGDRLDRISDDLKRDEQKVPGCASSTWVYVDLNEDGTLHVYGDSDSFISRGYIYILSQAFEGADPAELIANAKPYVEQFADRAGVRLGTVPSRANAFANIFEFMQREAVKAVE